MPLRGKLMSQIWVDGKVFKVDKDKNLLETILSLGFDLPYFCWHPALGSVGSCRQCAVRKYQGKEDQQGQIVMACMEPVLDDLHISIDEKEVAVFRKNVIEWLMVNHPHDCPICDEGGECHLQDMTVMAGHSYRRFRYKKRTHENQDLGPCINHEMNRCIQCYRCVRFYNDYAGGDDLQVFAAHDHVYFGRHEDGTLESEFSGNLVEVCPTGVFTDKTLKDHYTRKWDLTSAPSVCQHCSLGCNILAGERYGSLRRILTRFNAEVNGYFICDRGRFGYDFVNGEERIRSAAFKISGEWQNLKKNQALDQLKKIAGNGKIMGVGSPRASVESNYAIRSLVGEDNFYNGMSAKENQLTQQALDFLQHGPVKTPSLKEIESCDAVIIIGEDVTNTAPLIDLALKQSVLVQPLRELKKIGVPPWNDSAAREYIQDQKGPLYVLTPQETKLDQIATRCFRGSPDELSRMVMAIGGQLDAGIAVEGQTNHEPAVLQEIVNALVQAKRPLVITGTSLGSTAILNSSINLANALHQRNSSVCISLVFPECNSLGAGLMEKKGLEEAIKSKIQYKTLVVLENDLYRRQTPAHINKFLDKFENIIVLDHTRSRTTSKADLLLAAGTFAEADGTLVNNEGRAQRFFQVQAADEEVQESWRWMLQAGKLLGNQPLEEVNGLDELILSIENQLEQFKGIVEAAPSSQHRINGQKISRATQRYSGRTAMFADIQVVEPRPPQDPDSPLSFTMEGYSGIPPESATSFYWSPGWNSAQAINKFRNEIDNGRQQGGNGVRLIKPSNERKFHYLECIPGDIPESGEWKLVPLHHIFGTEELSIKSTAISDRSQGPSLTMNETQAGNLNVVAGEHITVISGSVKITLPVSIQSDWPKGHLGISVGFEETVSIDLDSMVQLEKSEKNEG